MTKSFVFRPLERGSSGSRIKGPLVSMHKGGALAISRAAMELMGNPAFVTLLVDEGKKAFAIRPAVEGEPNAYRARKQKTGLGVSVSGRKLTTELDIKDIGSAKRFVPQIEGKMLVVVLDDEIGPRQEDKERLPLE